MTPVSGVKPGLALSFAAVALTDSRVLPGAKHRAGGSRAKGRQPRSIKNKVDMVDTRG